MGQKWILVNIGCIECGVSSNIVGVFDSKEVAEKYQMTLNKELDFRNGGQNDFELFPMPSLNEVAEEYREVLAIEVLK